MPELKITTFATDAALQSYYRFENSLSDASPNGYTLTGTNSPTYTTGEFGNALHLVAASSQYASIANGSESNLHFSGSFTLYSWIYLASTSNNYQIISKENNSNNGYQLYITSANRVQFTVTSSSGAQLVTVNPATVLSNNTWYQVVGVYDAVAKTATVYINAVGSTGSANLSMTTPDAPSVPFAIGCSFQGAGNIAANFFDGNIDDVACFSRALSANEITQLYASLLLSPIGALYMSSPYFGSLDINPYVYNMLDRNIRGLLPPVGYPSWANKSVYQPYFPAMNLNPYLVAPTNASTYFKPLGWHKVKKPSENWSKIIKPRIISG